MRYGKKTPDGWHAVWHGARRYAIKWGEDSYFNAERGYDSTDGYTIMSYKRYSWSNVLDEAVRQEIILTAWPMVLE